MTISSYIVFVKDAISVCYRQKCLHLMILLLNHTKAVNPTKCDKLPILVIHACKNITDKKQR